MAAIAVLASKSRFQREESTLLTAVLTVAHAISALQSAGTRAQAAGSRTTVEAAIAELAMAMSRVGPDPMRKVRRDDLPSDRRAGSLSIA